MPVDAEQGIGGLTVEAGVYQQSRSHVSFGDCATWVDEIQPCLVDAARGMGCFPRGSSYVVDR